MSNILTSFVCMYVMSGAICLALYIVGVVRHRPKGHLRRHLVSCITAFLNWPAIFVGMMNVDAD